MIIFLDPGHTNQTPGKRSPDKRLLEYKYVREIVSGIQDQLSILDIESWNTHPEEGWCDQKHRTDSRDLVLRVQRINKKYAEIKSKGDTAILISIHVNAAGCGGWFNATGWSAYTTKGKTNSDKLAECLYDAAQNILKDKKIRMDLSDGDRDYEQDFYVIKHSNCPSVLTENFFMDSKKDLEYLLSDEGKQNIIDIHVQGILNYINNFYKF